MNKCWNCGVDFVDHTDICPLCKCITEKDDHSLPSEPFVTYPYCDAELKRNAFLMRIFTFVAIAAILICIIVDSQTGTGVVGWSGITTGVIIYAYITLRFSVQSKMGYRYKILLQTFCAVLVLVSIDYFTGYRGWAVNYVLPSMFILIDVITVGLMIGNRRNWQSYIPMQILSVILTAIPFILKAIGFYTEGVLCFVAFAVAVLVLVGTIVVGGKRARSEVYRRFHV